MPAGTVERWEARRLGDLTALCAAALPDEHLLAEDLASCCFDDPPVDDAAGRVGPSFTLGIDDGDRAVGAIGLAVRHHGDLTTAHVQVLVVDPSRRRRGIARTLLAAAAEEGRARGAALVQLGAAAPFYLFTGVDTRWTEALCCFERTGYAIGGVELDLGCPTRVDGHHAPAGIRVDPVRSAGDATDLAGFAAAHYPHWGPEFDRGADGGTVILARRDGDGAVVGAAAHSVNRFGVVGPVAVDPQLRTGGVGSALMTAVLGELAVSGLDRAEIAWTSTVRFYALACRATVLRSSLQLSRWL